MKVLRVWLVHNTETKDASVSQSCEIQRVSRLYSCITLVNYNCVIILIFSIKKETSVDFDMKKSISRTSFVGKDSAV
jgi:hypothetical protein